MKRENRENLVLGLVLLVIAVLITLLVLYEYGFVPMYEDKVNEARDLISLRV